MESKKKVPTDKKMNKKFDVLYKSFLRSLKELTGDEQIEQLNRLYFKHGLEYLNHRVDKENRINDFDHSYDDEFDRIYTEIKSRHN